MTGQKVKIQMVNTIGQAVYSTEVTPNTKEWSLPVWLDDAVANGIYQLKISTGDSFAVKPVLIQR